LAIVAYSAQANTYLLWTHEVGGRQTSSLAGTQGASYPFWSPDGKFIGFFADGKLKKVGVSEGRVQVLCDAPDGRGGAWNRDGVIVFSPGGLGGLFRVTSSGGSPVEMTKPDPTRFESSHRWPVFLPDGKHFLYLAANFTGHLENNAIFLGSLDLQERRSLVSTSANAAYAEPGYLVYLRDKTLVAQPFDGAALRSERRAAHFERRSAVLTGGRQGCVQCLQWGGVLVTQTGKGTSISQLTWFDRSGKPAGTVGMPGSHSNVRLSPDGRRVAADQTDPDERNIDIWIHEPARGATTRLTFDPALDQTPVWSPDGKQILFASSRRVSFRLYLKNADGSGPEEEVDDLGAGLQVHAWDWSRDGKNVLVRKGSGSPVSLFQTHPRQPVSASDVFSYDVSGDGQRFLILSKVDEANPAPLCRSSNWAIELVPAAVPLRRSCSAAVTLSFSC